MNITKHQTVLSVLERRALRYRVKQGRQYGARDGDQIDETGTVTTAGLDTNENNEGSDTNNESQLRLGVNLWGDMDERQEEMLKLHGVAPGSKPEGVVRLLYENVNGLNSRILGNDKLDKAKDLIDDLEADIVAYNEHRLNLMHKDNRNGISQMFKGGESEIRTVSAHNTHEGKQVGRSQEGGTCLLLYGALIEQYDFELSGRDESGLGRWVVMVFRGESGIQTRVVCGYNPCYNKKEASRTSYQQARRHFILREKDTTCPRTRFKQDLTAKLEEWRGAGDRIIVCLDTNEHVYRKSIGRTLTDPTGLAMREVVGDFTGKPLGATYFRGSRPIDAVWATPDVRVVGACVMPVGFGVGDHRLFVVDFAMESIVGARPPKVVRVAARRLNNKIPRVAQKYAKRLELQVRRHRIPQRALEASVVSPHAVVVKERADQIDRELTEYMIHSERKCRKIKSGRIPFSDEAAVWIRRRQVLHSLLRYKEGKIHNKANLKRTARRCGIDQPFSMTRAEIRTRLAECERQCSYFSRHGQRYRRKFLEKRLARAKRKHNGRAAEEILGIIQREKQRAFWRRLNGVMKRKTGGSVRLVQVDRDDGQVQELSTQDEVEQAIWKEIHGKRYYLAEQAPICQGPLRGDFGYHAYTRAGEEVLQGRFRPTYELDVGTRGIFDEIGRIRGVIPEDSVDPVIRHEVWQQRWRKAREKTSSSQSGRHFGHYIAASGSELISYCHALLSSLALRQGYTPERWTRALSCMLEKEAGCSLINKMRAILLMEADFNFTNKQIYGVRMIGNARKYGLMPEEIFSERGRTAEDGSLTKVLFYDIVRQFRMTAAIASVDASNCYDSIAHAVASLIFRAFGVQQQTVAVMLTAIEEMKYHLRTAYGDSRNFASSTIEVKFQGLGQGNGAAPAGWAAISITILGAHKRNGHSATLMCPMTREVKRFAAILFVDDCDLLHVAMEENEHVDLTFNRMQESVFSWGWLLMATGGAYKPPKCFYHLISFGWKTNGEWFYEKNHENEGFDLHVPMPDGTTALIEHLPVTEARRTLGVWTCPTGDTTVALKEMGDKCQKWIDKAKEGGLRRRDALFLSDKQMWPSVGYGLVSNAAPLRKLDKCLKRQYWQLAPLCGVIRTGPGSMRALDRGFYGVGLPNPSIECMIAQVQGLLMHFGCQSVQGHILGISVKALTMELGISGQPLQQNYRKYESRVTESWIKSLWEKVYEFGVVVAFDDTPFQLPRERDRWLMTEFEAKGYSRPQLLALNRVRMHQQVLYLSDILTASGKSLDMRYMRLRSEEETWSSWKFATERPSTKDLRLWRHALRQVVPAGGVADRLGQFKVSGHKIWEWRHDAQANQVYHYAGDSMDVYKARSPIQQRFDKVRGGVPTEIRGEPCDVRCMNESAVVRRSTAEAPNSPGEPETFLEVLEEWGHCWLWESVRLQGGEDWIAQSITAGSLMCVADGSYIRECNPALCSASFILECAEGRGRLIGELSEQSKAACAFRGEMLGLFAIHLLLLAVDRVAGIDGGSVTIYSDCLGALGKVGGELPTSRLPAGTKHADILKVLMVHCQNFSFDCEYRHVKAHQDESAAYTTLTRPAQINCQCDFLAKQLIRGLDGRRARPQEALPLESVAVFAGAEKVASGTTDLLRYWAQRTNAKRVFSECKILDPEQFEEVAWPAIHTSLWSVPRLFQLWAAKQVFGIAGTNEMQSRYKEGHSSLCPSCSSATETCGHVLHCNEEGRVDVLEKSIDLLDDWLISQNTQEQLRFCLIDYARGRGGKSMGEIVSGKGPAFQRMASSQDRIGWRRFMEGMVSKEILSIYEATAWTVDRAAPITGKWAEGLVVKLLEVTHGQWLYRNVHVHDSICGVEATARKEQLQRAIEDELAIGGEGLAEEDMWLLDINLDDLESASGESQTYWLLSIQAAREYRRLVAQAARHGAGWGGGEN